MEIYIGADHRGFTLKEQLKIWLQEKGYSVTDVGAASLNPDDDYPPYGFKVAELVAQAPDSRRGIVLCGSGAGITIAANKVAGIRAAVGHDPVDTGSSRHDDNTNVLGLAADYLTLRQAQTLVLTFLQVEFSPAPRYQRRVDQIAHYEKKH